MKKAVFNLGFILCGLTAIGCSTEKPQSSIPTLQEETPRPEDVVDNNVTVVQGDATAFNIQQHDCEDDRDTRNHQQSLQSESALVTFLSSQRDQASPTGERLGEAGARARMALIEQFRNRLNGATWVAGTLDAQFDPRTLTWYRTNAEASLRSPVNPSAIDFDSPQFSCEDYQTKYFGLQPSYLLAHLNDALATDSMATDGASFNRFFPGLRMSSVRQGQFEVNPAIFQSRESMLAYFARPEIPKSERGFYSFQGNRVTAATELFDGPQCSLQVCAGANAATCQFPAWQGNRRIFGGESSWDILVDTVHNDRIFLDNRGQLAYEKNGGNLTGKIVWKSMGRVLDRNGRETGEEFVNQKLEIQITFFDNDRAQAMYTLNRIYDQQLRACVNETRYQTVNLGYLMKRERPAARR